ncbi:hypothetical protein PG993_008876 [Apiospora rasikravindrae]|uniref:TLC domain-containing protein n=1 Tax=Apiospora rasikravindrae TaxID=990691 RepID=A0ABR1SPZ7_9PEZI
MDSHTSFDMPASGVGSTPEHASADPVQSALGAVYLSKIERMPREAVAQAVLPFAPLLLAFFSIGYVYMNKLLHSAILPRIYGRLFTDQDDGHRFGFAMHHNMLVTHGLLILLSIVPTMRILVGDAFYSDPLVSGSTVTIGDYLVFIALAYCGGYLGDLFLYREYPSLLAKLHHVAVLLVALTTLGILGDVEKNRSAIVSSYMILVWYTWDMVSELPLHAGLIIWRCVRNYASAPALSKMMRYLALWRLAAVLAELGVTVYLMYSAWRKFSTVWTVLAPMACWLWFYLQLQSAHTLYGISSRIRREHAVGARSDKENDNAMSLEEEGGPPRSGMLFTDPAYVGLTLGTTLLSYTHASGTRSHLHLLVAGGLATGAAMLLVRYFTQDSTGMAGLAARASPDGKVMFKPLDRRGLAPGMKRWDPLPRRAQRSVANSAGFTTAVAESVHLAHDVAPAPSEQSSFSRLFPRYKFGPVTAKDFFGPLTPGPIFTEDRRRDQISSRSEGGEGGIGDVTAPSAEDSSSGLLSRRHQYCKLNSNGCLKLTFRDVETIPSPEEQAGNNGALDMDTDTDPMMNNHRGIFTAVSEALRHVRGGTPAVDATAEEETEMEKQEDGTGENGSGLRQRRRRRRDEEPNTCIQDVARASGHSYDDMILAVQAGIDSNVMSVADLNRMAEELDCHVVNGEIQGNGGLRYKVGPTRFRRAEAKTRTSTSMNTPQWFAKMVD